MDQQTDSIAKVNTEYTADKIKILEGLEAVRKRPGCILGIQALEAFTIVFTKL
jgi:DNA gyrase/topoisomerase IV subunit B